MLPWTTYEDMYNAARHQPEQFWLDSAQRITWKRAPEIASRKREDGWYDWFSGATLNTCYNAVDRHVENGRGEQPALIWHSSAANACQIVTYRELQGRVAGFAGGLRSLGVEKGDRVLIAMPTMVETVIAMLACARIGAIHVVVFAGYAGPELAHRIDDVTPKVIIFASYYFQNLTQISSLPVLNAALAQAAHKPDACIIVHRCKDSTPFFPSVTYDFHMLEQSSPATPLVLCAEDPLYILHTSGTTGNPKGIVRDNGGHAVAMALSMELIYGCQPGDIFFTTSDLGWVVGHSYGVYAPLISGCTSILIEGGASPSTIHGLCDKHKVQCLFTTPTQLRLIRQESRNLSHLHLASPAKVFVAGEYAEPTLLDWARSYFQRPVVNHWWQTETGWSITAHFFGLPEAEPAALMNDIGRPAPGFDMFIVPSIPGEECGEIRLSLPLPPGCLAGVWKSETSHIPTSYLDGRGQHYRTFDEGMIDQRYALHMLGRSDDVIKVSGRRISAVQIEKIIAAHPTVAVCAVISVPDALRGHRPVAYVVPVNDVENTPSSQEIIAQVSHDLGKWTGLREIHFVNYLPMTVSGKIKRRDLSIC